MIRPNEKNELTLKGTNYAGALTAFFMQKNGYSVNVLLDNAPSTQFSPELSTVNPTSSKQLFSSLRNYKFLMKCSSLTPHLFYPRRVLTLSDKSINKKTLQLFDTLTNREREGSYLAINLQDTKEYNCLAQSFSAAVLFSEFRFDHNQATINLLLKAKNLGAKIIKAEDTNTNCDLQFEQSPSKYFTTIIDQAWPFPNDIRYSSRNFTLTLQAVDNKTILYFYILTQDADEKDLRKTISSFLQKLEIKTYKEISTNIIDHFQSKKNSTNLRKPSVNSLQETVFQIKKKLQKTDILTPTFSKFFNEFNRDQMTQAKFREIQNTCDEKFDLAKQSNIEYNYFTQLYYRYSEHIDEMIESAYEMLNSTRNGEKIWKQIECKHIERTRKNLLG